MALEAVRTTFTKWAPYYDATHAWLPKRREARVALGVQRGDRVLDVATGTGLNLPHLRELVGDEGCVTGIDLVPAMLDRARERIARSGWRNVEVREADAARLPLPDASYDKVICAYALNIIPEYVRAIEEVERVLAPGGRFVSLEMRSMQRSLPSWLEPVAHICAVHVAHQALPEIQRIFGNVRVQTFWFGMLSIAVATK